MMSFIVLAIIGAFAFAGPDDCAEASGDSNETYDGTCGENLVWELDSTTGALKIIGHGPMTDYDFTVKALYPPWWTMKDNIRSIEFIDDEEGGITYIGNCALSYIQYLTDTRIVMPDSVTSTGIKVFFDTNLTEIVLSKNLTELNNNVLQRTRITKIDIPDGVTSIGRMAFFKCKQLTEINIPDKVETIGNLAFCDCDALTTINFGAGISSISITTFSHDYYWTEDYTGCTPTNIYDENGKALDITTQIEEFKGQTFKGDKYDMKRVLDTVVCDGIIYKTSGTAGEAYVCGYTENIGSDSTIREQVSFGNVPCKVVSIGKEAFANCKVLESVTIPDSVTDIGEYAFVNCTSLDTIHFGTEIKSIATNAFSSGDPDKGIVVPTEFHDADENVIDLSTQRGKLLGNTFTGDISVMTLAEPDTFVCDGIIYKSSGTAGEAYVYGYTKAIKSNATIRESVRINGIICEVTSIGEGAFANCKALASITIPDTVRSIDDEAFYGCAGLSSVTIPASVASVGERVFIRCGSLERIEADSGNNSYCSADGVLFDKDMKTLIQYPPSKDGSTYSIPDTVAAIGKYAFADCTGLKTIHFGNGLTDVDPDTFGRFAGDEFNATKFYDGYGNELSLPADIEKFRDKMFAGDISEMKMVVELHTVTIFDGTSYQTYRGCIGDTISQPADPVWKGHEFLYWADEDGNVFDWIIPAKDVLVTAQWKSVAPSWDDDDDGYYPSHDASDDPDSMNKKSDSSAKVLIAAACVAAFMALILAFTAHETKR